MYHQRLADLGQAVNQATGKPIILAIAARPWLQSLFQSLLGRAPTAAEDSYYITAFARGDMTFGEVQAQVEERARAEQAQRLFSSTVSTVPVPTATPARPAGLLPAPVAAAMAGVPTWVWYVGAGALGLGALSLLGGAGGRRRR